MLKYTIELFEPYYITASISNILVGVLQRPSVVDVIQIFE